MSTHVWLQPLVLLAICLLAARFRAWPVWARRTALGGVVVDAVFGIGLLIRAQHQIAVGGATAPRKWNLGTYLNS